MQPADRVVALERQVLMLFSDDGKTFDPTQRNSKCSYGFLTERLDNDGNAVGVTELWRLLGVAMADTIAVAEPTSEQLVAAAKKQLSFLAVRGRARATMTTPAEIMQLFQSYPDNCSLCAAGNPCVQTQLPSEARGTLAQILGLDLALCGWTLVALRNALRKRNLFRLLRSLAAFKALVAAQVWGGTKAEPTEPTTAAGAPDITAALPPFSTLERPELVVLFMNVLRGEAVCVDEWDWDTLDLADGDAEPPTDPAELAAWAAAERIAQESQDAAMAELEEEDFRGGGDGD